MSFFKLNFVTNFSGKDLFNAQLKLYIYPRGDYTTEYPSSNFEFCFICVNDFGKNENDNNYLKLDASIGDKIEFNIIHLSS